MIAVKIETVNNKGDVEVLHRYIFKHPSQAHHLADWWIIGNSFFCIFDKSIDTGNDSLESVQDCRSEIENRSNDI